MADPTRSLTLTLTRWHKVQGRLQAELSQLSHHTAQGLGIARVPGWLAPSIGPKLAEQVAKAELALGRHAQVLAALVTLRAELGRFNAGAGISDKLAELDGVNQQLRLYRGLVALASLEQAVPLAELGQLKLPAADESRAGRAQQEVAVDLLPVGRRLTLAAETTALQQRAHALADELADLNQQKLTLTLPVEVLALAGVLPD